MRSSGFVQQMQRGILNSRKGSVAPLFALSLLPIAASVGAAVDYSRASSVRTTVQAALDAGTLAGAKDGSSTWQQTATSVFNAAIQGSALASAAAATPAFAVDANGNYSGTATASVPTTFKVMGLETIQVAARSVVAGGGQGDSCILTLDQGDSLSNASLVLNGAPNVNLTGCAIRSNTSMTCNGHSGTAAASIAAGTASGCANAESYAQPVQDKFSQLASSIATQCGSSRSGVTWTPGTVPPAVIQITRMGYDEYHVCGDLTLQGSGTLIPASGVPSVVVIENGSINLAAQAAVSTDQTTVVFTGTGAYAATVNFPNGNGKATSLTLSPPTGSGPWQAIALYQDPALTNVDESWGPGSTFDADGVVYMPNANITLRGVAGSGNGQCSKFIAKSFTTDGSVGLNFGQTSSGCTPMNMQRWADNPIRIAN